MNRAPLLALVSLLAATGGACGLLNFTTGGGVGPLYEVDYDLDDGDVADGCTATCCAEDASCACDGDTCDCGSTYCAVNRGDDTASCEGDGCTSSCGDGPSRAACWQDEELCDTVKGVCADPDGITAGCGAADLFDSPRDADGPIITEMFPWSPSGAADCWDAQVQIVDRDGDVPSPPDDPQVMSIEADGLVVDVTADGASFESSVFADQDGFFMLHVCFANGETEDVAVRIFDGAGHASNRFCVGAP